MTSTEPSNTLKKKKKRKARGHDLAIRTGRTPEKDAIFFGALEKGQNIEAAAVIAGYGRRTVFKWRKDDPAFEEMFAEAYEAGSAYFETVARDRAIDGWEEPVFYQGEQCGAVRKYDHTLLMRLLERRKPEYRQKFDLSGEVNHTVTHELVLRNANERALAAVAKARGLAAPQPAIPGPKVIDHEGT
jgi:hypothetical protein